MSAPVAPQQPETSPRAVMTARAAERARGPWLVVAITIAAVGGLLLVLALFAGVVLRSTDSGLGTGFGLVPFATAEAGIVVAVAGLMVAAVIALVATWMGRAASRPTGTSRRSALPLALGLMVGPCVLFLAGLVFASLLRRIASPLGYNALIDLVLVVLGLLIPVGIVAGVVVLLRARGVAAEPESGWSGLLRPSAVGGAQPGAADRRPRWVMLLAAAVIAAASLLFYLVVVALDPSFGVLGDLISIGATVVAVLGVVAAVIVTVGALVPGRTTSLRARAFGVIVVVVLIPSLCLAALGVWAYYRSWETATALSTDQAAYNARELGDEVSSIDAIKREGMLYDGSLSGPLGRAELTQRQRAALTQAIVLAYSGGHRAGAWWGDLSTAWTDGVLPSWAVRRLGEVGYAIGTWRGPSSPKRARIVAWRVGRREFRYYTDYAAGDPIGGVSAPVPVDRLLWIGALGVALIVLLGLLGAWLLSSSVVRPVRRLAEASGRLAEGEAGVTVKPQGPRELQDLAVSFNDMNAKLTKAQETEQAFLLSVSHELKTPLTSVRGYAEGIADGTVQPADGAAVIGAESSRLERLVGDLLESGRMRKAAFTVRREAVDLAAVAEDVTRRYEATARDAGLTLLINTEAGGGAVADHDRVLQVVSNLVENAIRCTPAPGTVTITTTPGAITVADTGRGLTSDDLPRAFERFYLYSRYGTDRPVGTGLGLAIVKELTEAMGGVVSVSSAVGVGTAFTVALPADPAPPAAPPGPAANLAPPASDAATVVPPPATTEDPATTPDALAAPTAAAPAAAQDDDA